MSPESRRPSTKGRWAYHKGRWACHKVDGHITKVDGHVTKVDGHVTKVDGHITKVDGHVTKVDGHVTKVEGHVTKVEGHVTKVDRRQLYLYGNKPYFGCAKWTIRLRCRAGGLRSTDRARRVSVLDRLLSFYGNLAAIQIATAITVVLLSSTRYVDRLFLAGYIGPKRLILVWYAVARS